MTYEMKMLLTIGVKHTKHYDIIHHVETNVFTLRVWLGDWDHIDFTTSPNIPEKHVLARYMRQSKSYFSASPLCSLLDKYCGKSKRESGKHYSIIDLSKAFEIVQKIEPKFTKFDYKRPVEQYKYYTTPNEMI